MSVRIVVEQGPDRGRSFVLNGQSELRLGRGAGYHFNLKDPGWQGGLRIECSKGVYKVTNDMATAIYLGKDSLTPGENRIWYNGARLQPTAETILVLHVDAPREEGTQRRSVEEVTAPSRQGGGKKPLQIAVIVICFALALVGFLAPSDSFVPEEKSAEQVRKEFEELDRALQNLQSDPEAGRVMASIQPAFHEARFCEVWNRPVEAYDRYLRVRNDIDQVLSASGASALPPPGADALRRTRAFVIERLVALTPSRKEAMFK